MPVNSQPTINYRQHKSNRYGQSPCPSSDPNIFLVIMPVNSQPTSKSLSKSPSPSSTSKVNLTIHSSKSHSNLPVQAQRQESNDYNRPPNISLVIIPVNSQPTSKSHLKSPCPSSSSRVNRL